MNKMNKIITVASLFILIAAFGCTKNFKDYNTNPNALTKDHINDDNVYLGGFFKQMEESVFPIGGVSTDAANSYQLVENLCGDIFSGYQGMTHNWNSAGDNTTYNFSLGWNSAAFNLYYTGIQKNYDTIKKYAVNNPDIIAVATIIKVQAAHRTVDMYGPIPYFNTKTNLSSLGSVYDPMDSIYYSFFRDIDSSVSVLKKYVVLNANPLQFYDAVYRGNYTQWIKFANSLKLRLAMRIRYVDAVKAKQYAEAAVNDSYGVITDNADNAAMQGVQGTTYANPLSTLSDAYQEARMSANMQSFLVGYSDPRLPILFKTSTISTDPANTYRGIRNGSTISSANASKYQSFSSLLTNFNILWMPSAEVFFLRSEGALLGWNMGASASQLYETGIQQSFSQWGVGSASTYIANTTSKPAAYVDPVNTSNNSQSSELDTTTIKWNESLVLEQKLKKIITQKWIAMYPNGQEAWSEYRRTGYPSIFSVKTNNSGGTISSILGVRRLPYPQSEAQLNARNVAAGIQLLIAESPYAFSSKGDNGGTNLWWDKKGR